MSDVGSFVWKCLYQSQINYNVGNSLWSEQITLPTLCLRATSSGEDLEVHGSVAQSGGEGVILRHYFYGQMDSSMCLNLNASGTF